MVLLPRFVDADIEIVTAARLLILPSTIIIIHHMHNVEADEAANNWQNGWIRRKQHTPTAHDTHVSLLFAAQYQAMN